MSEPLAALVDPAHRAPATKLAPYPWLTARPWTARTAEVTPTERARRQVIERELRCGRLMNASFDDSDVQTVAHGLARCDHGALLASGVGPIDWDLLAEEDRDAYRDYARAALTALTAAPRPGQCPGYPWLTFTDDADALIDMAGVDAALLDERMVIAAELRAGHLRPGQVSDDQVDRVARALCEADDQPLIEHGLDAIAWEDASPRDRQHYQKLAATAAGLIAEGAQWR